MVAPGRRTGSWLGAAACSRTAAPRSGYHRFLGFAEFNLHQVQTSFELLDLTVLPTHLQPQDHGAVLHQLRYFGDRSFGQHVHDGCDLRSERRRERHPAQIKQQLTRNKCKALFDNPGFYSEEKRLPICFILVYFRETETADVT
ncbi:hypothetical protein INR49_009941 [Caranx melampygus]|nr:hypothetical protein INR49_009941 [Caranx melampygus]